MHSFGLLRIKALSACLLLFITFPIHAETLSHKKKEGLNELVEKLLSEKSDHISVEYEKGILKRAVYLEKSQYLIVYLSREKNNLYLYQNVSKKDFNPLMSKEHSAKHWGTVITREPKFKVDQSSRSKFFKQLLGK